MLAQRADADEACAGNDLRIIPAENSRTISDIGIDGSNLSKQGGLIREASDMQRVATEAKKAATPKADDAKPASAS